MYCEFRPFCEASNVREDTNGRSRSETSHTELDASSVAGEHEWHCSLR